MNNYHESVQLEEVITLLDIQPGERYIDGTLGGGGHTKAILNNGGIVLGIDQDDDALAHVRETCASEIEKKTLTVVKGNFGNILQIAKEQEFDSVAGVLLDIGVSSHQFDTTARGFSFQDAELDMRMDTSLTVKAKDLVNGLREQELVALFTKFGEEPFAKKIARTIVARRAEKPIERTSELAELIRRAVHVGKVHPATRVFQALRIAVNDELHVLEEGIAGGFSLLKKDGRLAVISFHSLEDRIVKHFFEQKVADEQGVVLTKKPLVPTDEEIAKNNRSRSAKLRVIQKI